MFPGDAGYPGDATTFGKIAQFAPRVGVVWTPNGDERTSVRASWGVFYDTPHLFFNTRFANNPPWGAQITIPNPPGGFADPYLGYPGGNPFPALNTGWATQPFPAFGVYVNTPLDLEPTSLQQWNVSVQRQFGDWLAAASYLGNHSSHLWRATELNPAVFGPGATTGNTNQRRALILQNAQQGQFYGTIGQLDDTGRANYNALLLSLQRRLKNNLSVLSNWTISKCMSDPATTEITGPTIVESGEPGSRLLVLLVGSPPRRQPLAGRADAGLRRTARCARDLQRLAVVADRPLAERQPLDRHDRRRQRADRPGRPAGRADSRRSVRHRRADRLSESRGVHVARDRHLQHADAVHDRQPVQPPERLRADPHVQDRAARKRCSSGGKCST